MTRITTLSKGNRSYKKVKLDQNIHKELLKEGYIYGLSGYVHDFPSFSIACKPEELEKYRNEFQKWVEHKTNEMNGVHVSLWGKRGYEIRR